MFSNGERHKQQKAFLIAVSQNMLRMGRHIPNIMDIMPEHFIKWNFKEGKLNYIACPLFFKLVLEPAPAKRKGVKSKNIFYKNKTSYCSIGQWKGVSHKKLRDDISGHVHVGKKNVFN